MFEGLDELFDARKSPVGREFESMFFSDDCVIASVRLTEASYSPMQTIAVIKADLSDTQHQGAVLCMMDAYSADPMGDGKPLSDFARLNLIPGLLKHPTAFVFLAFHGELPCGIATCFQGFSTFAAKPLINISDFFVDPALRGQGIGRMLLERILDEAVATECCKLTLEVQQNNSRARSIYGKFGFKQAVYAADAEGGGSLYMVKSI